MTSLLYRLAAVPPPTPGAPWPAGWRSLPLS